MLQPEVPNLHCFRDCSFIDLINKVNKVKDVPNPIMSEPASKLLETCQAEKNTISWEYGIDTACGLAARYMLQKALNGEINA